MQESKMLKVTGILMIIGGIFGIIIFVLGFFVGIFRSGGDEFIGGLLMLASIAGLLGAILELVAGIMGVKAWDKPGEAGKCFILGIVIIVISLLSNILAIAFSEQGMGLNNMLQIFIGLIIPLLYVIGAYKEKQVA